jgi:hypothetical protein
VVAGNAKLLELDRELLAELPQLDDLTLRVYRVRPPGSTDGYIELVPYVPSEAEGNRHGYAVILRDDPDDHRALAKLFADLAAKS